MKIKRIPPQNWAFFNEHGPSYSTYGFIGFIGQVLSGVALTYAVHRLLQTELNVEGFALLIVLLALLVGLFVELANRTLAKPAIKPFVVKDTFAEQPLLRQRHQVLNRSYQLLLLVIAGLSYFLSAVGSTHFAEDRETPPLLIPIDSIEAVYAEEFMGIEQAFAADTSLLKPIFQERIQAAQIRFQSDSLALRRERSRYEACAQQGNVWCRQQLASFLTSIDHSRSRMADSLASIQQEQSRSLENHLKERKTLLKSIQTKEEVALKEAKTANHQTITSLKHETKWQGIIFLILTIAGQTIFYGMVYLQLQIEAGSEISHEAIPNEFWAEPSIIAELGATLNWRTERGLRRLIRWLFKAPVNQATDIPYAPLTFVQATAKEHLPHTNTNKASCAVKDTPKTMNVADAMQRLKQYKKRLSSQQQKALKQERETGRVTNRTQAAIENNARWVEHYSQLLNSLQEATDTTNGVLK